MSLQYRMISYASLIAAMFLWASSFPALKIAFRAYDPCFGCATHTLPGQMPMVVKVFDHHRELIDILKRD